MFSLLIFAAAAVATPSQPACTAATARRTTVAEIGENYDRYKGKCVQAGGLFASVAMYGSVEDLYLGGRFALDGNRDPAVLRRGRIGLYSADGKLRGLRLIGEGIPHVEIIGIVDSCAGLYDQAIAAAKAEGDRDPIIMMGGYCHYYGGAVVRNAIYSFNPPRRYERLLGDANRRKFGDFVPMPSDWRDRAALEQAMTEWRAMIERRDRDALRNAHHVGDTGSATSEHLELALERLLDRSVVATNGERARQSAIFVEKLDVDRLAAGRTLSAHPYATLCLCRTADCTGKWPIADRDADNHVSRPYVCTRANWRYGKGGRRLLETSAGRDGGLGEPRRTSMTR